MSSQLTRYCDRTVGEVCDPPPPAQLNLNSISTEDNDFGNLISNSSISETEKKIDILQALSLLYAAKRLSLSALGEFAKLINSLGHDIPIDQRTILQTTKTPICSETFKHFSLKKGIVSKLKKGLLNKINRVVKLQINIDRTSVFKT